MTYKLITIDLDDTLLKHDLTISERNIKTIQAAVQKGVKVTLASGRPTKAIAHYLDALGLDLPVIAYQGARIVDTKTNEVMYKKELEYNQAIPIIKFAEKIGVHCNVYIDDTIHIEKKNKWAEMYANLLKVVPMKEVGKLSDYIKSSTTKVLFVDEHERLQEIKPEAEKVVDESIQVYFSKPNYLEFTNKYGTKGQAVKYLGDHFGIKQEEIMAIGDSYNDITMIEYAGLGVCMSNGPEDVKEIADYITLSNEEDGVAHAIEKFIL